MSSTYRLALEQYLRALHLKADLLIDIGGSQNRLPGRTASFEVQEYLIADLAHPNEDSPKPDIILDLNLPLIAAGVNKSAYKYYEKADIVTCFEVMAAPSPSLCCVISGGMSGCDRPKNMTTK
jgi:hypothetical protein